MDNLTEIQKRLFELADEEYKSFHGKLIPNVSEERIIGVRTPVLRKYAKDLSSENTSEFLNSLPHRFYDENNLHAFIIEQTRDYTLLVKQLDSFLPHVDNWATCDMMSPKCFYKNRDKLYKDAYRWIESGETYCVRFGICVLMKHYLEADFKTDYLQKIASIRSDEYYVKMAIAWYFATALASVFDNALPYIKERKLDTWVHNKAIQKACESFRISNENKKFLKQYKVK